MTISDEEREQRRQAVAWHRGTHRLEGIEPPEPIRILEERYIAGEIDEVQLRQGCFEFAQSLSKVPLDFSKYD